MVMSYVREIQTVYNVLLVKKGAHGVNARCENVSMHAASKELRQNTRKSYAFHFRRQ